MAVEDAALAVAKCSDISQPAFVFGKGGTTKGASQNERSYQ